MKKNVGLLIILLLVSQAVISQILTPVKWSFEISQKDDKTKEIIATASIDENWKMYGTNLPEGGPISTTFVIENITGATLDGVFVSADTPKAFFDAMFQMELTSFEKKAVFSQTLKITDEASFSVSGYVRYMACDDTSCLPPTEHAFSFGNSVSENEIPIVQSSIETPFWTPVVGELKNLGDITSTQYQSYWIIFIFGFLGGLLALLTPCVWPMIPMTVSFFLKSSKNRNKAVKNALIYGLSIIVIYLGLGLLVTGIFGASSLNSLATSAIFNLLFFALLVVFALSFFGLFEITLPSSWINAMDKKADTTTELASIFFMAFTLVLVSFSCTGPIIGTLLVEAASTGSVVGPAIGMFGFALALAIPFAFFSLFPSYLQSMPRSGGWLSMVKVTLGFLELALALKFFSVADLAYGWGLLSRDLFIALWILIFLILGLYYLRVIRFPMDKEDKKITVPRALFALVSFLFVVYLVPGMWGKQRASISAFTPPMSTQIFNKYNDHVKPMFEDFDLAMEYAQQVNKPVLIDFSGYGCVNCREMEATVFEDDAIKGMLKDDFIFVVLYVDDKQLLSDPIKVVENNTTRTLRTQGDKWSYLQRLKFGANAQPYYVVLNAEGKPVAPSYAFNKDVKAFEAHLKQAIKTYKNEK
jgi:thiol:disulfide interchange protein